MSESDFVEIEKLYELINLLSADRPAENLESQVAALNKALDRAEVFIIDAINIIAKYDPIAAVEFAKKTVDLYTQW